MVRFVSIGKKQSLDSRDTVQMRKDMYMDRLDRMDTENSMNLKIYDLLYKCGITAKYKGFFYTSYAVMLCIEDMQRLLLVTKRLYPEVAKFYGTSAGCVERNIRTISEHVWLYNREELVRISRQQMTQKPTASQFISILAWYVSNVDIQISAIEACARQFELMSL